MGFPEINFYIQRCGPVRSSEVEDLRQLVGWDQMSGCYERILAGSYAYFSARQDDALIGFVNVISDGVADALLVDLMVHPNYQRLGLGQALVQAAIQALKADGIRCIEVIFEPRLESFYRQCGFHMMQAGIIDTWDGDPLLGTENLPHADG
jgi:GNAT superfamily N-acetyltransferase